jgi:diacylglycerol kinase (ATP)
VVAGVDVIVNRTARGLRDGRGVLHAIASNAPRAGAAVHETRDLDELARVAAGIASRRPRAVVLAGGDGSLMRGLSALARAYAGAPLPPIAIAPAGTMCTIARNLGMRGDRATWTARVIEAACAGTARRSEASTLRVRGSPGGGRQDEEHVAFIFGAGLVARFFDAYEAASRPGAATAAVLAARIFAGSIAGSALARHVLTPTRGRVAVDGSEHPARTWSLLLASTVRDVGLHFLAPYRAGDEPDRFHIVGSGLPPRALGAQLPRVLTGRPMRGEPRIDALARSLEVAFDEPDGEGTYILDGERLHAPRVTVTLGPTVTILSP